MESNQPTSWLDGRGAVPAALTLVQLGYAGYFILCKAALSKGANRVVFAVYRDAIALLILEPLAYFSERYISFFVRLYLSQTWIILLVVPSGCIASLISLPSEKSQGLCLAWPHGTQGWQSDSLADSSCNPNCVSGSCGRHWHGKLCLWSLLVDSLGKDFSSITSQYTTLLINVSIIMSNFFATWFRADHFHWHWVYAPVRIMF